MSTEKKRPKIQSRQLITTVSIDILLTIVLFDNFSQWGTYQTLSAKIVGVFACIYVLNDWMTTRSSFAVYSPRIFFTDIITIFLFANFPNALSDSSNLWGYSPFFWLAVALVEFSYAFWDMVIKEASPTKEGQKNMIIWVYLTFLSTMLALGTFIYQVFGTSLIIGHAASAIVIIYLGGMTIKWNWERYQRSKAEGTPFLN